MNQQEVRQFVENYVSAFQAHVMESHPTYVSIKLTEQMDKDIGNRPFYWSWVEKMNLPVQPLTLTFFFDAEQRPEDIRGEHIHFGSSRLQQIFQSTRKHGRFVCLYENNTAIQRKTPPSSRRSTPLTPWLNLNLKISFICDKKRDFMLYLGINLHQPRIVHDFYSFLCRLSLSPSIPDYFYTLDRQITLEQAKDTAYEEVMKMIEQQDHTWAEKARERLTEELDILKYYYEQMKAEESAEEEQTVEEFAADIDDLPQSDIALEHQTDTSAESLDEHCKNGGTILDFLRMNGIQTTSKEEINQTEWKKSTPEQEKQRRMDELKWQYEPRIEVSFINGGLFYLYNVPQTC